MHPTAMHRQVTAGPLHMETLVAKNQLGQLLHERDQYDEALVLLRETLYGRLEALGSHHVQVFNARRALSRLLKDMGRVNEAQRVLRPEDVKALEKSVGGEHRVTHKVVETLEDINRTFDELELERTRLEEKLEEKKQYMAEERRQLEEKLDKDKRRLEERNEQLQAEKERLLYDMQRRGRPLQDDRNAIRRGLQAGFGRPLEPYHFAGDTSPGSTSSSEAGGLTPSEKPLPSLPPGAPSSTSSGHLGGLLTWEEADHLWFPESSSVAPAPGLAPERRCRGAQPSAAAPWKRQCPGVDGSFSGIRGAPSLPEASPGQELLTEALVGDRQALTEHLLDEGALSELQAILSHARSGMGVPQHATAPDQQRKSMPAHGESKMTPQQQALHAARHHMQTAHTDAALQDVIRTLAVALGAIRTETGTIKALHAVLFQLIWPGLSNVEVCTRTGASLSNFAKWRRRVQQVDEVSESAMDKRADNVASNWANETELLAVPHTPLLAAQPTLTPTGLLVPVEVLKVDEAAPFHSWNLTEEQWFERQAGRDPHSTPITTTPPPSPPPPPSSPLPLRRRPQLLCSRLTCTTLAAQIHMSGLEKSATPEREAAAVCKQQYAP